MRAYIRPRPAALLEILYSLSLGIMKKQNTNQTMGETYCLRKLTREQSKSSEEKKNGTRNLYFS